MSALLKRTVEKWGSLGTLTLPELLRIRRGPFVVGFAVVLVMFLVVLGQFAAR